MQEEIIYSLLMPAANRCACFCVQVVGFHNLLISAGRWCGLSSELSESHTCCFAPSHCKKTQLHTVTPAKLPHLIAQAQRRAHTWL